MYLWWLIVQSDEVWLNNISVQANWQYLRWVVQIVMRNMMRDKKKVEIAKEIELFIQYGVLEDMRTQAVNVLDRYRQDIVGLRLLREFYRSLPEAREEAVLRVVQVGSHQGVLLLGVITVSYHYLYLVTADEVIFLGENGREAVDDIVAFFGFPDTEELTKTCRNLSELEDYNSDNRSGKMKCPVCSVLEDEYHYLGCSAEVCPWCDGQLSRCNCRFDQLGIEQISNEEEILKFQQLLVAKGRIRFAREQSPSYPSAGDGLA